MKGRIAASLTRSLIVAPLLLVPAPSHAQSAAGLVRFAFDQALAPDYENRPPWACLSVRRDRESEPRDALPSEIPDPRRYAVRIAGVSECVAAGKGAYHRASGAQAVILKVEVGQLSESGHAWYTTGWYRARLNAGASRCEATWDGQAWVPGVCRPLWIS